MLLTLLPCLYLVETQIVTRGMKNGVFFSLKTGNETLLFVNVCLK